MSPFFFYTEGVRQLAPKLLHRRVRQFHPRVSKANPGKTNRPKILRNPFRVAQLTCAVGFPGFQSKPWAGIGEHLRCKSLGEVINK